MHRIESGGARFITFSCQHRLPLFTNPNLAALLRDRLFMHREEGTLLIFAWVIMPEHVHLLCQPRGESTLAGILRSLKMSVAKTALDRWQQSNAAILQKLHDATGTPRFWLKGGGFDRNVRNPEEFAREFHYIHHNPVTRGLAKAPTDYPWSSSRFWSRTVRNEPTCDQASW